MLTSFCSTNVSHRVTVKTAKRYWISFCSFCSFCSGRGDSLSTTSRKRARERLAETVRDGKARRDEAHRRSAATARRNARARGCRSQYISAMACWSISAICRRTRTTPNGRCGRAWNWWAAVPRLKTRASLQTRVGIATGLVVVGDLIGTGSAQEQAVVGETPNLRRASSLAGEHGRHCGQHAELLASLFELHDLGANEVKDIFEPVRAWAALRPSSVESRFEALRTATTPLVGARRGDRSADAALGTGKGG